MLARSTNALCYTTVSSNCNARQVVLLSRWFQHREELQGAVEWLDENSEEMDLIAPEFFQCLLATLFTQRSETSEAMYQHIDTPNKALKAVHCCVLCDMARRRTTMWL
eukprot:1035790-Amphidinium_carterae.1